MLYEDAPYLVTVYDKTGEAVRSDKFACFQPQPDPGGVWLLQYGVHNYINARPAGQAGDCDGVTSAIGATAAADSNGVSTGVWVAAGAAVVALLGVGGVVALRRRASAGERE